MSLANAKERKHIAVPKPRGVLAVHASAKTSFFQLDIDYDFAGTRQDEYAITLPDGSTHTRTRPCWWSNMHAMLLDSTARAHSASSKST